MHRDVHYTGTPKERDAKAIEDILNWCSDEQLNILQELANEVNEGRAKINHLNFAMAFAGVSGYPFHAFCRKYCLKPYREWMAAGDNPIQTDERGHGIYKKEEV